jgi:hypothetical protein
MPDFGDYATVIALSIVSDVSCIQFDIVLSQMYTYNYLVEL